MKYFFRLMLLISFITIGYEPAAADPMEELLNEYGREFEAVKPEPNSSVRSDYKFDQMAMSGIYTTRSLNLLYQQNQEMIRRQDAILEKYEMLTEQNKEIIRLLVIIAGQDGKNSEEAGKK